MEGFSPTDFPTLNISDKSKEEAIKNRLSCLIVDSARRSRIKDVFLDEMRLGLSSNPERPSSLQMENTFIPELTNGTETGDFLALDLGGTNFRVMMIHLVDGIVEKEDVKYYDIPKHIFLEEGTHLFNFLAESIDDFMKERSISHKHYHLGFTFSFPMEQKSIKSAILTKWTKSYNCPGVEGQEVVTFLNEAIKRKTDLDITVNAILNDTTGTLVQGSYLDKRCAIAMIIGTGNNACYLERVSNIEKWKGKHEEKEVIMDIEWGAFGDNGVLDFIKTEWDTRVDDKSLQKKSFTFEKYISGKFLGDVVREILVSLANEGLFCTGSSQALETHEIIRTSYVTKIEEEAFKGELSYTKELLHSLDLDGVSDDEAKIVQYVCGLVSYRAAILVSFLTSILLDRLNRPHCTIAMDGSLYENHPRFKPLMEHLIKLYSPDKSFSLILAKDGSGKGAGLVSAIEERLSKEKTAAAAASTN